MTFDKLGSRLYIVDPTGGWSPPGFEMMLLDWLL
jgi:hypothetical protein